MRVQLKFEMKRSKSDSEDDLFTRPTINFSPAEQPGRGQMSTPSSDHRLTIQDAVAYLRGVKDIFQDNKEKYDHFLEILKDFWAQRVDTAGVILRVKELFKGHRHLLLGFNTFLPEGYEITLPVEEEPLRRKKKVEPVNAFSFMRKIKTRFEDHGNVFRDFVDIMHFFSKGDMPVAEVHREVSVLLNGHTDLLEEFMHFLPDTLVADYVQYNQLGGDHILHHDSGVSPMMNARSMGAERVISFNDCVTNQVYQGMQDLVSSFCEKVKEKFHDSETNEKFSNYLHSYIRKFLTSSEFHMLVASVLGNHADLMKEFKNFLCSVEKTGCLENSKIISRTLKVEEEDTNDCVRDDTHKVNECGDRESDRCGRALTFIPRDVSGRRMSLCASKKKFIFKPINELDLSKCESCTPSYRRLPQNYPIFSASHRTEIGAEELNDRWVSIASGNEDYLFKHVLRNQYEENLFRCEDFRFELDMLLESVNATIKSVEELLPSITINAATSMTDGSFCIEDHLTALNLRCIERLYGDHGLDVMDVLRKNSPLALPVILIRLRQKQEEWGRFRSDFSKVWAEVYAKDYHKSLDHQSFYFKQQDSKNLIAEALLAEIKEMSEKNQNEDDMLLSVGAGYRQPIRPHMAFEYSDTEIHGDLYQVIKYYCGEICTPEHHDKIMTIWMTFLESFFGDSSQSRSAMDTDYVKDNNHVTKSEASLAEGNGSPANESGSGNYNSLDVLKHEDKSIPTEKSLSSGVQMVNDSTGIRSDGSPNAAQVACESDVITQVHTNVLDQDLQSNIEVGLFVEPFATASGLYVANADCGIETMPIIESQTVKPFMVKIPMAFEGEEKHSQIFYGNDSFYLIFRFHQMLYERMHFAKLLSSSSENKGSISNDSIPADPYARFKDALCSLLSGSSDNSKFEDDCRDIIGAQSYILFTLDKLIHKLIKQLQTIVTEEMDHKILQLWTYERSRDPDKFSDVVYHQNACFLLPDDNLYRIECFPSPTLLTIQLMRNEHDKVEFAAASIDVTQLNAVFLSVPPERREKHGVFLQRNKTICTIGDEGEDIHRSMEGLVIYNGLESRVNSNTMKVRYIRGSEDFMYRTRRRRKALYQKSLCNGASNGHSHKRKRKLMFSR